MPTASSQLLRTRYRSLVTMPSVVFLRAVNVGGANRCQPAAIAKQMARFGIINIGAVGTFVVREDVGESTLRTAIARKLSFKCEIMISPARDIIKLASKDPFARQPSGPNICTARSIRRRTLGSKHHAIRERIAQATSQFASSSSKSAPGRRLAAQDHCHPKQIRARSVPSADEGDQLPGQDREAPRCARNHAQLEHDRKSRENSGRQPLTKSVSQESEEIASCFYREPTAATQLTLANAIEQPWIINCALIP